MKLPGSSYNQDLAVSNHWASVNDTSFYQSIIIVTPSQMFWGLSVVGYTVCLCNYMQLSSQHVWNHSAVKKKPFFFAVQHTFQNLHDGTSWWNSCNFCIRMLLYQKNNNFLRILFKTTILSTKQWTLFFEPIDSNHIMMQSWIMSTSH